MLDPEQTFRLIEQAQNGDRTATGELIKENVPLIISVAKRYKSRGVEYDDLIQLGSIGLFKAIMNFNSSFEVKFSTYAVPMIVGEIKRYLRDDGMLKVSRALKQTAYRINKFSAEFSEENKRAPTAGEIAEALNIEPEDIAYALDSSKCPVSLFDTKGDDSLSLIEKLSYDNEGDNLDKLVLADLISRLAPREQKIVYLRYFRDKTQAEVAAELGVSQVQISRLESRIIEKLRENLKK